VVADLSGAEVITVVDGERDEEQVEGDTHPIRRVHPGGWSQQRFQQRAENSWEKNAADVAEEVASAARRIGARVVVAAGEQRSLTFLEQHLPADVAPLLRQAEHGTRAADGSDGAVEREVRRAVATAVAEDTVQLIERFVELRDAARGAVEGAELTFELLREAMVATLLVHDDVDDERQAWLDPAAPTLVAVEAGTLEALGAHPQQARLFDVAVWSALGTGADVRIVPGSGPRTPAEGVGAIIRGV
jgi:hypothetical protein